MSDLIIRGRVTDVRLGRTVAIPQVRFVLARVELEEVFKGVPEMSDEGYIDIEYWLDDGADLDDLRVSIPDHEATFVLFNQGLIAERTGHPEDIEQYRYQYTEINGSQGTLRDVEGRVRSIDRGVPGWFPESYEGGPYEDLLADLRRAAAQV